MTYSGILYDRNANTQQKVTVRLLPGCVRIEPSPGPAIDWWTDHIEQVRGNADKWVVIQAGKQFLEVVHPQFAQDLQGAFPDRKLFRKTMLDTIGVAGCLIIALLGLGLAAAVYLVGVPFLAERAVEKVPREIEQEIGDAWLQSLTRQYTIDTATTQAVQCFFDTLRYPTQYPIQVTVVREPVVNAFALPGGKVVLFDGLLKVMDRPEQLAALLGHEASHVELGHSTRAVFREMANSLFLSLLLGDFGEVSTLIGQQGQYLNGLSYSRRLEMEADAQGIQWMRLRSIPIAGMRDLFQKMKNTAASEGTPAVPNFLSTHPSLDDRIQRIDALLKAEPDSSAQVPAGIQQAWHELRPN